MFARNERRFGLSACLSVMLLAVLSVSCGGSDFSSGGHDDGNGERAADHVTFESPQTRPLRISGDGSRLFAANTAGNRLSVFSLDEPGKPELIAEIPVGLEPVGVWPLDHDRVWVLNHVSGTISVVSVSGEAVTSTIPAGVEPSDILVLADLDRAYVTASRDNELRVYEVSSEKLIGKIPLEGEYPRALEAGPGGQTVYAAFSLSGNNTTLVRRDSNPEPPAQPEVEGLPEPPLVSLIVDADDPDWTTSEDDEEPVIDFTLLDRDVAVVDPVELTVTGYHGGIGTINRGLAVEPVSGELYVSSIESLNRTFLETELRGHFVNSIVSRLAKDGDITRFDLHEGLDPFPLPNPEARAKALADPAGVVFSSTGSFLWVAAFGSDRIAKVDAESGEVIQRIEISDSAPGEPNPAQKRGPGGMTLSGDGQWLYVQNRISNTISVIETGTGLVSGEVSLGHNPEPRVIREGRGFLYDARLSGNGMSSCASCHIDGQTDNLAWNLGNPEGEMITVTDPVSGEERELHPMKGPMVTQPLTGLRDFGPFHWQGDMEDLGSFNRLFDTLMGGAELSSEDLQTFNGFIERMVLHPNPYLELDGSFPDEVYGIDPEDGLAVFQGPDPFTGEAGCSTCHVLPGEQQHIEIVGAHVHPDIPAKVPHLGHTYKKRGYRRESGEVATMGFGLMRDGGVALSPRMDEQKLLGLLMAWPTGTSPTVGHMLTVGNEVPVPSFMLDEWTILEEQARDGRNDLVLHGRDGPDAVALAYVVEGERYADCQNGGESLSASEVRELAEKEKGRLTLLGLPPGMGGCDYFSGVE